MDVLVTRTIEALLLPPGSLLLLILFGLVLSWFRSRWAKWLLWGGLVAGYLCSMPLFAGFLINQLQTYPALRADQITSSPAQAIVVLSAGRFERAPEYGGVDTVGENTLLRVRYAAYLHRHTGLPLLVSGGRPLAEQGPSLAQLMADSLRQDFAIDDVWLEERSRTTAENALYSKELLQLKGVGTVFLVTQAWHMPRSVAIFEQFGVNVIPAPTAFVGFDSGTPPLTDYLPDAKAMYVTRYALHEMVGRVWYWIRY